MRSEIRERVGRVLDFLPAGDPAPIAPPRAISPKTFGERALWVWILLIVGAFWAGGQNALAGGGILGHPDGIAAGVASMRDGWEAAVEGVSLETFSQKRPALKRALAQFAAN